MQEMRDEIARAYSTFGLPRGTAFAEIVSRYRRLAPTMHPDRYASQSDKKRCEEKLKKLNHAKDILYNHFSGRRKSHITGGSCLCQPEVLEEPKTSGNGNHQKGAASKEEPVPSQKTAPFAGTGATQRTEETAAAANKPSQDKTKDSTSSEPVKLPPSNLKPFSTRFIARAGLALLLLAALVPMSTNSVRLVSTPVTRAEIPKPMPKTTVDTEKIDEATFLKAEEQRAKYDEEHRYDTQINSIMTRIHRDQELLAELQHKLERLPVPASSDARGSAQMSAHWFAQKALEREIQETLLDWKAASDWLDQLQRAHPEIPAERFAAKPTPPQLSS